VNRVAGEFRLARSAISLAGVLLVTAASNTFAEEPSPALVSNPGSTALTEVQSPVASPEPLCCRVRRFGPYVTPDPRSAAPTLAEAVGDGLLPPFGWGWYGFGYPGFWGWGYGGWSGPWSPYGASYPYPYGFNGSFWYPHGSSWPYPSLSNWTYGGPRYFGPIARPGYSPYPLQSPYGTGPAAVDGAQHLGHYYW